MAVTQWHWELGTNHEEVHALIGECDAYNATPSAPAPVRNIETTKRRVAQRAVHVARHEGVAVATFTLSEDPPFSDHEHVFPAARRPLYLGRLAVAASWMQRGTIVGAQCLRRAVEVASQHGADALRAEANPDLEKVFAMLLMFGFKEFAREQPERGNLRAYLQKTLPIGARP